MEKPMSQKKFQTLAVEKFVEMEKFQALVLEQFAGMRESFAVLKTEMQNGFKEIHAKITAIETILKPLSKAVDTDAEKIIEHDKRLVRIENKLGLRKL